MLLCGAHDHTLPYTPLNPPATINFNAQLAERLETAIRMLLNFSA